MNFINNLKLPVILKSEERQALIARDSQITVDLEKQIITCQNLVFPFEIEGVYREKLLKGQDGIEEILEHIDLIKEHERKYAK